MPVTFGHIEFRFGSFFFLIIQVSLTDTDACQKEFTQLSHEVEIRHHQPLRLKKKIYEFYTAPITKFWADSVRFISSYFFFIFLIQYIHNSVDLI